MALDDDAVSAPLSNTPLPGADGLPPPVPAPWRWRPGFAALGPAFYTELPPRPLPAPYWVGRSRGLARELGVDDAWLDSDDALQALTGNRLLEGSRPLATVYSGHQFGMWAGQLGDGRALLLGETAGGQEIQLKGAGLTPYSRMGDGRAVLRSSIREFLCSEAMHGLGIPTTRALAVTGSDAPVRREETETSAVVTRVAPSFIRFGHFEHFSSRNQLEELRALTDHVIDHHYPDCREAQDPVAAFLAAVARRTAALLAGWQAVGFCHGVMNTDNMSILGLTIDYGPFQFLDGFNPNHICNHSDSQGRYAYNQQPNIAYWNLFCLGQALLPLIGDEERTQAALKAYPGAYPAEFEGRMRGKLGLASERAGDRDFIQATFRLLANERTDYTLFWHELSRHMAGGPVDPVRDLFIDRDAFDRWMLTYSERTSEQPRRLAADLMHKHNPRFVLRNHLAETAIRAAKLKDFSEVHTLLTLLETPFDEHPGHEAHAALPPDWAAGIEISCSS